MTSFFHFDSSVPQEESPPANENVFISASGNSNIPLSLTAATTDIHDLHQSPASSPQLVPSVPTVKNAHRSPRPSPLSKRRVRAHSFAGTNQHSNPQTTSTTVGNHSNGQRNRRTSLPTDLPRSQSDSQILLGDSLAKAKCKDALRVNDSMVYLDGPQVYTCAQCRTHMTSHDDIISKSFHGRHGRAYLFDQCVNVTIGPSEERRLITGMHTVSDIFCKRCKTLVGWTYLKAYESSQKYKEGKYIIEKINLHLEESDYYTVAPPAGERTDRWRQRSMSWGGGGGDDVVENGRGGGGGGYLARSPVPSSPVMSYQSTMVFEYRPSAP